MKLISYIFLLAIANLAILVTPSFATTSEGPNGCKIYDITRTIQNGIAAFDSNDGAGQIITETYGKVTITGTLKMGTHLGTHINLPPYVYPKLLNKVGYTTDFLNLEILMGPVLVIETPKDTNITADVLKSLEIPEGTKRVIFKTSNTDNCLMDQQAFVGNYTGLTRDGAKWLAKHTDILFVGIDYMSIAIKDEVVPVHKNLFRHNAIIPVENLKLDWIEPGEYYVFCLPLNLVAEAAPARCILVNATCPSPTEWC